MEPDKNNKIFVTMPSLPPLAEYVQLLEGAWERGILTHNGPLVQRFEKGFCAQYHVPNLVAVSNGTIALQMAIKALKLKGEIITTPFTWIATISAIMWEGCRPVFADIDPETLNLDPGRIEAKITRNTCAIMPVHVFGNACNVEAIEAIAKKHGLKIIYDAAHAVGTMYKGRSLMEYGDISATSFHATKLINTAEGGGCVTTDQDLCDALKRIRFFGHNDAKDVVDEGLNGKMTEVHAALGLANLKYAEQVSADRKLKYFYYRSRLGDLPFLSFQSIDADSCNYSYFPVIFETEQSLLRAEALLNSKNIFPRRYFYPSVNTYNKILPYEQMPVSEGISKRILCLPLYRNLPLNTMDLIIDIIRCPAQIRISGTESMPGRIFSA